MAARRQGVVLSFLYWSLRWLLALVVLRRCSEREKEIEILVLRISYGCWSGKWLARS